MNKEKIKWAFFGGSEFSVYVLDELKIHGILPSLIITTPDKPKGRKLVLTPTPVKVWAEAHGIEVIDPVSLKKPVMISGQEIFAKDFLSKRDWDLFLVASYGKIIPADVFEIPKRKTLNIHPSMLPKYRGASPIQSQILEDEKEVGVTIMQIDEGMDTGPVLIQKSSPPSKFIGNIKSSRAPLSLARRGGTGGEDILGRKELEKKLAIEGARLFAHILSEWMIEAIDPIMQDESKATFCKKMEKEDGKLDIDLNDLSKNSRQNLLKIKAFEEWPTAYFFAERNGKEIRVIITDATIENDSLKILKVIPEGKKEMPFEDFLRGLR